MSEQDKIAFEKWYKKMYPKIDSLVHKNGELGCWQAATAEANKRIDALEGEVANLHLNIKAQEQLGYELQANNNDLREVLEKAMNDEAGWYEIAKQALSATQAESLQAFENEVIEKVYQVVENISDSSRTSVEILEAIRALKEVK